MSDKQPNPDPKTANGHPLISNASRKLSKMKTMAREYLKAFGHLRRHLTRSNTSSKTIDLLSVNRPEIGTRTFPLVDPDSSFRTYWDCIIFVSLCYVAFVVPIRFGFDSSPYGSMLVLETSIDAVFIVDLILNFMTAYVDEEQEIPSLVVDKCAIAKNYIKGWFVLDFLAILPIDTIASLNTGTFLCGFKKAGCAESSGGAHGLSLLQLFKVLRFFKLLKLFRLAKLGQMVHRYRDRLVYTQNYLLTVKMASLILFVSHMCACLYGYVYEYDEEIITVTDKYIASFYWAVQTITTVGYGDLSATDNGEKVVSVATMLIGGFVFSWMISNMNSVLDPNTVEKSFTEREKMLIGWMKANLIPHQIATRFSNFYNSQNKNFLCGMSLLDDVPYLLKAEIFSHLYSDIVKGTRLFMNTSDGLVAAICIVVRETTVPRHDFLFKMGECSTEMFIIAEGSAGIITPPVGKQEWTIGDPVETLLDSGDVVGQAALLEVPSRIYSVMAVTKLYLLSLSLEAWRNITHMAPALEYTVLEETLLLLQRLHGQDQDDSMLERRLSVLLRSSLVTEDPLMLRRVKDWYVAFLNGADPPPPPDYTESLNVRKKLRIPAGAVRGDSPGGGGSREVGRWSDAPEGSDGAAQARPRGGQPAQGEDDDDDDEARRRGGQPAQGEDDDDDDEARPRGGQPAQGEDSAASAPPQEDGAADGAAVTASSSESCVWMKPAVDAGDVTLDAEPTSDVQLLMDFIELAHKNDVVTGHQKQMLLDLSCDKQRNHLI